MDIGEIFAFISSVGFFYMVGRWVEERLGSYQARWDQRMDDLRGFSLDDPADDQHKSAPPSGADSFYLTGRMKGPVTILYRDSNGDETERQLVNLTFRKGQRGQAIIEAYCLLRQQKRTFALRRVQYILSGDGELLDPETYFIIHLD